jgi:glycerol-3-phosphate acyltransferase PlsX
MKTVEGAAKGLGKILKQEITRGIFGKIGSLFVYNNLKRFKNRLNPEEIGGAMIYGLNGVVVKAQGSSKAKGFASGIRQAAIIVRNDVLKKVKAAIESEQE